MAREVLTGTYEFDPGMNNPDNKITDEKHSVYSPERGDFHFFIPYAAPFFADDVSIKNDITNEPLVEGVDYLFGHYFTEAMDSTGRVVVGSIRFLKDDIVGIIAIDYHTLGGNWGYNDAVIIEELSNRSVNPLTRAWGEVSTLPFSFPPTPHDQRVDSLTGSDALQQALTEIANAVISASTGSDVDHVNDTDNPHEVDKDDIELGLVENYPPATDGQAADGTSREVYMTAYGVALAINQQIRSLFDDHVSETGNVHGMVPGDIGLGLLNNYATATIQQTIDGTRGDLFVTPEGLQAFFEAYGSAGDIGSIGNDLDNHLSDYDNPHRLTAAQLDAYTRGEVDLLLQDVTAEDTPRFSGLTEEEWRESLPTLAMLTDLMAMFNEEYGVGASGVESVDTTTAITVDSGPVPTLIAGSDTQLVIALDDGTQFVPSLTDPTTTTRPSGDTRMVSFSGENVYYVTAQGFVEVTGVDAITIPASYTGDSAVDPSPEPSIWAILMATNRGYLLLDDGNVLYFTDSSSETVVAPGGLEIDDLFTNIGPVEHSVLLLSDTTLLPRGHGPWVSVATTALSGVTNVISAAVGDNGLFVLLANGDLRGWEITGAGTAGVALTPLSLGTEAYSAIAGQHLHFVFLRDDGTVETWGDNTQYQRELPDYLDDITRVAAGRDFTATLNSHGVIQYWGDVEDNRFIPPVSYPPLSF